MKYISFAFLVVLLVACTAITNSPITGETPINVATQQIIALTKSAQLTGEAETETAVSPKNDATITAIMASKYAGGTEAAETGTAMPTFTLTPAIPVNSTLCVPGDLKTDFLSQGATGNIWLEAGFTNVSGTPCYMQAWPQAILVYGQGKPLDVDYNYIDMSTSDASFGATEQASDSGTAKVGLWPGWRASLTLIWWDYHNWCETPINSNLVIQLTLMDNSGMINVPTDFRPSAVCDTPGTRTDVSVSKFELTPSP